MHSKQTRNAFTRKSELPRSLLFLTTFPRQKRGQTDLEGEMSFFDQLPWQHRPCLPRAPAPGACTCQLVARVAQQPQFPDIGLISPTKGGSGASWLRDMDTCPLSIGLDIGDFHKGQPTAGRQAPPGHCHSGLNWRQRLCL